MELTFSEQIKILLNRENMSIKEFAELLEERTGVRTSRQNLTQKLKRDNFQEQDMRIMAAALGYRLSLSLEKIPSEELSAELDALLPAADQTKKKAAPAVPESTAAPEEPEEAPASHRFDFARLIAAAQQASDAQIASSAPLVPDLPPECINPHTQQEYPNNSVRKHPYRLGYLQIYDAASHAWTDMAEKAFMQFQAQKRQLLGRDYEEPHYLD